MFDFFAHHAVIEGDYVLEDIKVDEELGHGNAHVYTAYIKQQPCALKQIEIKTDYEYQNFLKQITFMRELSQDSVWFVKYQGYLVTKMERNQYDKKKYAFIVMECAQQNLQQFLSRHRENGHRLKVKQWQMIMEQILVALATLEQKNIAHCDIKPQNILIMNSSKMTIKLCDVGSCKVVSSESMDEATILGTVPFLAPQLIKIKNKKMVSTNAFKSDVFSFGLVILYMINFKKFKSHERMDIQQQPYKQIILEWIRESKQLCDNQLIVSQMLRNALEFDEFKRVTFKQLRFIAFNEKKKKSILTQTFITRLEKEQQMKMVKMQQTTFFQSVPSNQLNLFQRKGKITFTKTISNGNAFKITKTSNSPSPIKRTISSMSSSPEKGEKSLANFDVNGLKKIIYITEQTKNLLPEQFVEQGDKNFVLSVPLIKFKRAESITILPGCSFDIFYNLQDIQCKRLFIQCNDQEHFGLPNDAPILTFCKIRANFTRCQLVSGFQGIFRIIANSNLQLLEIRLTESEATFEELLFLLDRLITDCPNLHTFFLCWERRIFTQQQHIQLTQKIAKLPIKKLSMIMNQNYIKYEKPSRWLLPKQCQILYLDYAHNLLASIINNLSISLANNQNLKEIYLNFENNNLKKGQIHMLIKSIVGLKNLQRVMLSFALNKIEQVKYMQNTLLEFLNINYLELKLQNTEVQVDKIIELIDGLKELFQFNLKILKVSCDRNTPVRLFRQIIEEECINKSNNKARLLRCDVVGFDNKYSTVYLKKKDKGHSNRVKGGAVNKKSPKLQLLSKGSTLSENLTLTNFHSNNQKEVTTCYQFYTTTESFNNYICLTCCQLKQTSKQMYYCKYCLTSCAHKQLKDHYFVKVSESTRCVCSYSGACNSDAKPVLCGQKMRAIMKKEYQCWKCEVSYCMVCIENCRQSHPDWIKTGKQLTYFQCKSKIILK